MRVKILVLAFILLITSDALSVTAQDVPSPYRIAIQADDGLAFYRVDESGTFTLMHDFGSQFGLERIGFGNNEWIIEAYQSITPSSDGRFIAFIAVRPHESDPHLFIYDVAQDTVEQVAVSGYGNLYWSPDNTRIALVPNTRFSGSEPRLTELVLYSLETHQLLELTAPIAGQEPVYWLPDSQYLLYTNYFLIVIIHV